MTNRKQLYIHINLSHHISPKIVENPANSKIPPLLYIFDASGKEQMFIACVNFDSAPGEGKTTTILYNFQKRAL